LKLTSISRCTFGPSPNSKRRAKNAPEIRRDKQGAYHLHLDGVSAQFKARDLDLYKRYGLVVPIESVSGIAPHK
jgi:hypothetical protein